MSGSQLWGWTKKTPTARKASTTMSLSETMIVLRRADSLVPAISSAVSRRTTALAGRLQGALDRAWGSVMPKVLSRLTA